MSDKKALLLIVLAMGILMGIWWGGWFDPITELFLAIKGYTTYR